MNIFLYGYYGFGNFGDELLLKAILDKLLKHKNVKHVSVRSLSDVSYSDSRVTSTCIDQTLTASGFWPVKIIKYLKQLFSLVQKNDCTVIGGGGLFLDKNKFNLHLFFLAFCVFVAKTLSNKKVHIIGVSFDYLTHSTSLWFVKYILKNVDSVACRDPFSQAYATQISGRNDIVLSEDLFYLTGYLDQPLKVTPEYLGLALVDYFGAYKVNHKFKENYDKNIIQLIRTQSAGNKIIYFVFQKSLGLDDEKQINFLQAQGFELEVVFCNSWADFSSQISRCKHVITMRFHLALIAAALKVPVTVIDHELKLSALAYQYSLNNITLQDLLQPQMVLPPSRAQLELPLDKLAENAEKNFKWLS